MSSEAIVEAGIDVGFGRLSVSAVGARLGVSHTALYRYFGSRDALASAMIDYAVRSIEWPEPRGPWREFLTTTAWAYWRLYETYPGLATEVSTLRSTSRELVAVTNRSVLVLLDAGFDAEQAVLVVDMLGELVTQAFVGAVARAESGTTDGPSDYPHAASVVDGVRRRRVELMSHWLEYFDPQVRDAFAQIIARPPARQFERKLLIFVDGVAALLGDD